VAAARNLPGPGTFRGAAEATRAPQLQRTAKAPDYFLVYKSHTLRHLDVDEMAAADDRAFYVAGYGPRAFVCDAGTRDRARPPPDMVRRAPDRAFIGVELTSESTTERLDALLEPEVLCRDDVFAQLRPYTELGVALSWQRARAQRLRWCNEDALRGCIMRGLRAAGRLLDYFVYAALSPLHDRTLHEIHALVYARAGGAVLTVDDVRATLANLQARELAVRCVHVDAASVGSRVPLGITRGLPSDYDVCLGAAVRQVLRRCFPLAPGTRLVDAELRRHEFVRSLLRRSVNATRTHLLVADLERQNGLRASTPAGAPLRLVDTPLEARSQRSDAPTRATDINAARIVLESQLVADILRLNGLGHSMKTTPDDERAVPSADFVHLATDERVNMPPLRALERHCEPSGRLLAVIEESPRSASADSSDAEDWTGSDPDDTDPDSPAGTPRPCRSAAAQTLYV
jgi:hypothetical protein